MRRSPPLHAIAVPGLLALAAAAGAAQGLTFPVTLSVETAPTPQAAFAWGTQSTGTEIRVYRRSLGAAGAATWVLRGSSVHPVATYVDTGLAAGASYEYKLERVVGSAPYRTAFAAVSIDAPLVDQRGGVLLVVDQEVAAELAGALRQLEMDLAGDGWDVVRMDVPRHGSGTPEALKAAIKAAVAARPQISSALLFGRVPMVRSGMLAPDGHTPGAHETDTFYADLNGIWTDATVNVAASGHAENENLPGDGKYDQSSYPTALELAIGRVTFHSLPSHRKGEIEYLRDYLHKDHAWRTGLRAVAPRALLSDTNSGYYLFTARNWLTPMLGSANVQFAGVQPAASTGTYLWAVTSEDSLDRSRPVQALFLESFKSYKQKWWRSDNVMRGLMAQPDWGLACTWGARPPWYFHHMAAGATLGYSALRTQNNAFNGTEYGPPDYSGMERQVSNNLLGDPTLRLHPVAPPGPVSAARAGGTAELAWPASPAPDLLGYHVYRSADRLTGYARLTAAPIAATAYVDAAAPAGTLWYQVRAVATTSAPTGTYRNQSQAAFARLDAGGGNRPPTATAATLTAKSNSPVCFAFAGADPDGDALTPIVVRNPQHGQLRWYKGQPFYVSAPDYVGADSIEFTMSDGVHTSAPATIAVAVDAAGDTLLAWECPDVSGAPSTAATWVAPRMQAAAIAFGPSSPRSNPSPYTDQILIRAINGGGPDAGKYLAWTVAPQAGYRQTLTRTTFGLASLNADLVLNAALRVSGDGFATSTEVPLQLGQSSGGRALHTAVLAGIPGLSGSTAAAEFRLYLWHNGSGTDAAGIGKLTDVGTDRIEDLIVQGAVEPDAGPPANAPPVIGNAKPGALTVLEDASAALALIASDADADPLTWSVLSQGGRGTAALGGTPPAAVATYTPDADRTGADGFTLLVADGRGGTDTLVVAVTIVPVNDAPSFLAGPDQTAQADGAARSVPGWATAISAGPADEAGQALSFAVAVSDPSLFAVQPAVAADGTLSFAPAIGAAGTATIAVTLHDDGGTANGGVDASTPRSALIAVVAVDADPPAQPPAPTVSGADPAQPTLSGVTEPGATVRIHDGADLVATVAADGSGAWTWTPPAPLDPGAHVFTVVAVDAAGNASPASPSVTVVVPGAAGSGPTTAAGGTGEGGGCGAGAALALLAGLGALLRPRLARRGAAAAQRAAPTVPANQVSP